LGYVLNKAAGYDLLTEADKDMFLSANRSSKHRDYTGDIEACPDPLLVSLANKVSKVSISDGVTAGLIANASTSCHTPVAVLEPPSSPKRSTLLSLSFSL
jgi:hypothetical protein